MHCEQIIDGCLAGSIGEHGLADEELAPLLDEADQVVSALNGGEIRGAQDILALPTRRDDIETFGPVAENLRSDFQTVIILGTGGSSLGGQAITALAPASRPCMRFIDNLDPASMSQALSSIDVSGTAFIVISKSGTTTEILAQYLIFYDVARKELGESAAATHFVVVTDPIDNPLRRLAAERGHTVLDHDPGVGGRFSVLSTVGMLPAAVAGLDVVAVRNGATAVVERAFDRTAADSCPPALGAAVSLGLARHRGVTMSVLKPYGDQLDPFAAWYRQLWAESLGKGGHGTTPIDALGPVDQHSQLQLYLDGPRDKMFTIVQSTIAGTGPEVPSGAGDDSETAYLSGIKIGDLVSAQQRATAETLIQQGRPTRLIRIERPDEATMGALSMHFILETIIAARVLGVNPFDQPAVEEGKALTREYLRRGQP